MIEVTTNLKEVQESISKRVVDNALVRVESAANELSRRISIQTDGKVNPIVKRTDNIIEWSISDPTEVKEAKNRDVPRRAWNMIPNVLDEALERQ